jgi:chaperonin GroEL
MNNQVVFGEDARAKMLEGIRKLEKAVGDTLGPAGHNAVFEVQMKGMLPIAITTKDGHTVAKHIGLEDPIEEIGKNLVRQAAFQTNSEAGDGTTTATVIAGALIKALYDSGPFNAQQVSDGIMAAAKDASEIIDRHAVEVDDDSLYHTALISTNGDEETSRAVADAFIQQGKLGRVKWSLSKQKHISVEHKTGVFVDTQMIGFDWINNQETRACILQDPYILITDEQFHNAKEVMPWLGKIRALDENKQKSVLLIADVVDGEAMGFLTANHRNPQTGLNICVVLSPAHGMLREEMMSDLALATGGIVHSKHTGMSLTDFKVERAGRAKKIIVDDNGLFIQDGAGDQEKAKLLLNSLIALKENSENENVKNNSEERYKCLVGGISEIKIGGYTDLAKEELSHKVEDAVNSCRSALEEGLLPGGGIGARYISRVCQQKISPDLVGESFLLGYISACNAMEAPLRRILENALLDVPYILDAIASEPLSLGVSYDYSIQKGDVKTTKDGMIGRGIVDPAKVTRAAIRNACSVASKVILTGTVLYSNSKSNTHE